MAISKWVKRKMKKDLQDKRGLHPEAKKKVPREQVKISSGVVEKDYVKLVIDTALASTMRRLPSHMRNHYRGNVEVKENLTSKGIVVTLTHIKNDHPLIDQIILPAYRIQEGDTKAAIAYGESLGEALAYSVRVYEKTLIKDEKWKQEFPELKPGKIMRVNSEDSISIPVVPDMSEAMRVATLLDKTRCAICGFADIDYPDWDDECSHTPEERAG